MIDTYCDTCSRILNSALADGDIPHDLGKIAAYHRDGRRFAVAFGVDKVTRSEVIGPTDGGHLDVGLQTLGPISDPVPAWPDLDWLARMAGIEPVQ